MYESYGEREHTLGDWGESRSTVELIDNNNNNNNNNNRLIMQRL